MHYVTKFSKFTMFFSCFAGGCPSYVLLKCYQYQYITCREICTSVKTLCGSYLLGILRKESKTDNLITNKILLRILKTTGCVYFERGVRAG